MYDSFCCHGNINLPKNKLIKTMGIGIYQMMLFCCISSLLPVSLSFCPLPPCLEELNPFNIFVNRHGQEQKLMKVLHWVPHTEIKTKTSTHLIHQLNASVWQQMCINLRICAIFAELKFKLRSKNILTLH